MRKTDLETLSVLVICEVLGYFVNTLTVDGKYSLPTRENLPTQTQEQLSKR